MTPEDLAGVKDPVAHHLGFAIPEYITQVDATAHLDEVFVRLLSLLGWEGCLCSGSVGPELADCGAAGKDDAELDFEHGDVVGRDHVPCFAVRHQGSGNLYDMYLQVVSSLRVFLLIVAARAMLRAAVIRLKPKMMLRCRLVFGFICTFHSRN